MKLLAATSGDGTMPEQEPLTGRAASNITVTQIFSILLLLFWRAAGYDPFNFGRLESCLDQAFLTSTSYINF